MMEDLDLLIQETVATHISSAARVTAIEPLPLWPHEHGWSGAQVQRYRVSLPDAAAVTLITKTMPLPERRVVMRLSAQQPAHGPDAHARDLTTDGPVLTCMQDVATEITLRMGKGVQS